MLKACALFLSLLFIDFAPLTFSANKQLFVNKITACKGFEQAPLMWKNVVFDRDRKTKEFAFSIDLESTTFISMEFGMEFTVWKCDASGSLDSCEYFLKEYRVNNMCSYLSKKRQFWSVFVEAFEPPLVCPIKPALYKARQIPFKSDFLNFLPISEAVWRARLKGFDNKTEILSCVDVEIKVGLERAG